MAPRTLLSRLLSPAGFGLALMFFLLPFVAISCDTQRGPITATFTGMDMIIGGQPDLSGAAIGPDQQEFVAALHQSIDVEPLAILAAIVIFVGMASALLRQQLGRHCAGAGLATLALALLIWAELRAIDRLETLRSTGIRGVFDTPPPGASSPRYGFWLVVLLLGGLAVTHSVGAVRTRNQTRNQTRNRPNSRPQSRRQTSSQTTSQPSTDEP